MAMSNWRALFIFLLFRPERYVFLVVLSGSFFSERKVQPAITMNVGGNGDLTSIFGQIREAELQRRNEDVWNVF